MYSKRAVLTLRVVALTLLSSCCDVSLSHPVCQYLYLHVCVTLSVKLICPAAREQVKCQEPLHFTSPPNFHYGPNIIPHFAWRFSLAIFIYRDLARQAETRYSVPGAAGAAQDTGRCGTASRTRASPLNGFCRQISTS